jgi:hypothetical protein
MRCRKSEDGAHNEVTGYSNFEKPEMAKLASFHTALI